MSQYCEDEDLPLFHRLQQNPSIESHYGDYTDAYLQRISDDMYSDDIREGWYAGELDDFDEEF